MNGGPPKKIRRTFGISATFAAAEYSAQRRLKSNPQSVGWMAACVCLLASLVRTAALLSRLERTAQICRRNFQRQRPTRSGVDALSLPFFLIGHRFIQLLGSWCFRLRPPKKLVDSRPFSHRRPLPNYCDHLKIELRVIQKNPMNESTSPAAKMRPQVARNKRRAERMTLIVVSKRITTATTTTWATCAKQLRASGRNPVTAGVSHAGIAISFFTFTTQRKCSNHSTFYIFISFKETDTCTNGPVAHSTAAADTLQAIRSSRPSTPSNSGGSH